MDAPPGRCVCSAKSTQPSRISGFLAAAELILADDVLSALDAAFPPPPPGAPPEMLQGLRNLALAASDFWDQEDLAIQADRLQI